MIRNIVLIAFALCFLILLPEEDEIPLAMENISKTKTYEHLNSLLDKWCDDYYIVKPNFIFRLNPSDEGFYQNNNLGVFSSINSFKNKDILEVILAHEFGHHYIEIKYSDLDGKDKEMLADLIASELIGKEKVIEVLEQANRNSDDNHFTTEERVKFIKNQKTKILKP